MDDLTQRQQALDISQSFIVQAPAGSGKTELLTQRYLKLLANCTEPENVIAMTFTNKAVDEMTHRVLSALKLTKQSRPEEPHKQVTYDLARAVIQHSDKQGWDLLQNPKRLKISTIDGLYSLITNRYPLPKQLVPRQIMAQQWERDWAYQYAARETLKMIDDADYGMHTYFASDIAYHFEKLERGYGTIVDIWGGADHHGYIARVKASIKALGNDPEKLKVLLSQMVHLYRGGEKLKMSTRSGKFVTLRELRYEVGNDAARFFYILRKSEQHMDFDLDLAKSKTNENPVFYIQYAHARICSVLSKAQGNQMPDLTLLNNEYEQALIKQLSRYSDIVKTSALNYDPHLLAYYLRDLAGDFHSYYNNCDFLIADKTLQASRLELVKATQQVIKNGLGLLGVSAPDEM